MTKSEAIELFGGTQIAVAKALGVTRGYVSQWPEVLDERIADRVMGAAVRLGRIKPTWSPVQEGSRQ
jgi:transcriptional repressor of cell division inhibition gene dicB